MLGKIKALFTEENPVSAKAKTFEKISYSQSGEDIIVSSIFDQLSIPTPTYLDLGAHHPFYLSNTYYFYKKGCVSVNVEPDPFLIEEFKQLREKDINLNVGVGLHDTDTVADFYVMIARTLNTFSREEAERIQEYGGVHKIEKIIQVPLVSVNTIIKEKLHHKAPNFVSVDVEGLDFEIVSSFDFDTYRPEVFCIETLSYSEDKSEVKLQDTIDYMLAKNYFIYADTYLNTIFVDTLAWRRR